MARRTVKRYQKVVGVTKYRVTLFGALAALLASLTAILLIRIEGLANSPWIPGSISSLLDGSFLLQSVLWLAVAASAILVAMALVGAPTGITQRHRELEVPKLDSSLPYRAAVEVAWVGERLTRAEYALLRRLEGKLGLTRGEAAKIELETIGCIKEEVKLQDDVPLEKIIYRADPVAQYRTAVQVAWADKKLNKVEEKQLGALELDLGMSGGQAEEIELEVMGGTREEVVSPDDGPFTHYRTAVRTAWADEELNMKEKEYLDALESEIGLSPDEAIRIEREVMGKPREEVPPPPPPPTPDDEQWMKLVEECVEVVDELDRHMVGFDPKRRDLADHVILRLEEVLERSGVDVISEDETFDGKRHKLEKATTKTSPGAPIAETLRPGFAVGRRVLRRARVRLE